MKIENYIIILLLILVSCSDSKVEHEIELEYKRLAEGTNREIVINEIDLLETTSIDFETLANIEIEIYNELNEIRDQELQYIQKMDSLIQLKMGQQQCLLRNVNAKYRAKYLKEMELDSIQLKENKKERLQLKIGKMEDELKVFNILKNHELLSLDSIGNSENFSAIHKIDINIDGKNILDTLLYISFNNRNYSYLNKNLFLEH